MTGALPVFLCLEKSMATDSLGQLTVDLIANTGGFEAGMDRVQRSLKSTTKEAEYQAGQLDRLVGQIDPVVGAYGRLDKMEEQLRAHRKAGRLDVDDFNDYLKKLNEQRLAVEKTDSVIRKSGVTAAQTTSAFRQLPAQISDIFTSLAGGQNPLLVLIQQGGQIKDSFGGVGATFEAFSAKLKGAFSGAGAGAGAIDAVGAALSGVGAGAKAAGEGAQAAGEGLGNMAEGANTAADAAKNAKEAAGVLSTGVGGVSVGLLAAVGAAVAAAAAIGVVAYGFIEGSKESDAFKQTIIQTGNSAGVTTGILASMAETVGASSGKIGMAADALNQLAGDGKIARASFEEIASAAIASQNATGKAVSATIAEFSKIADDPVAAAKKLNDEYNFLTGAIYQQIVALKEQDKEQEAATLLTDKYAEVVKSRSSEVIKDLGYVESAWKAVKAVTTGAIDSVKGFGRDETTQAQIAQLDKQIDSMHGIEASAQKQIGLDEEQLKKYKEMAGYDAEKVKSWTVQKGFLQGQLDTQQAIAAAQGNYAEQQRKSIDGIASIHKDYLAGLDKEAQKKKKIEDLDRNREDALKGKNVNVDQINKEYDVALKDINEKFKEKVSPGSVDLSAFNDAQNALKALVDQYDNSMKHLDALQKAGLISQEGYSSQTATLIRAEKEEVAAAYDAEIAALESAKSRKSTTAAQSIQLDEKIADTRAAMVKAMQDADSKLSILQVNEEGRLKKEAAAINAYADSLQEGLKRTQDSLNLQLSGFDLGPQARQQLQDMLRIRQEYEEKLDKLERDHRLKRISDEEYSGDKEALEKWLGQRLSMQQDYYRREAELRSDWINGASRAFANYMEEARDTAGQTENLFSNALHGIEDAFVELATSGKLSFKSLADSIIADLARMAAKTLIVQPLISALFGGGGSGGGVAALGGLAAIFGASGSSGSSGSSSMSLGSLANTASSAYSIATGVGPATTAGYASGGIPGAIQGIAGYYKGLASNTVSTISNWFTSAGGQAAASAVGQTAAEAAVSAAAGQGAASTGYGYGSSLVAGEIGSATYAAPASTGSMAYVWPLAILMGMYQSGKLYDSGVRYDKDAIEGSKLSKVGDKLGTAGIDRKIAFESIGLADKALSGLFGGKTGAILSGSTFAMAVEGYLSSKLFGTGYQTKDSGLSLQATNGDLVAQSYQDQKKKKGLLGGSNKKRTVYGELGDDQEQQLQELYAATQIGVIDLVKQIGVTVEDGAFDAMKIAEMKISTQGKTDEEIQTAVSSWFSYASDVMVATLDKGVGGFGYSFTELARRINVFTGFNAQLDLIGVKMYKLSAEGMELANAMVEAAGGTEAMTANINTYYDKFFSDTEKTSDALKAVRKQFSDMNVTLPETRAGYRDMVSAIDLTTEAGQKLFLELTASAANAASAYDILEARQATYYSAFYSESENTARSVAAITDEFKKANVTLPSTRAGYRAMVEGIDKTTESGKKLYDTLMALSGDADAFYKAQEQTSAASVASAMSVANAAMSSLQRAVNAEKTKLTNAYNDQVKALNAVAAAAQASISDLTTMGSALDAALKSLNGTSDTTVKMLRAQAQATIAAALAFAQGGGSLGGYAGLTDALATVSDNDTDLYSSLEDFNREQGRTANIVAQLSAINGDQLSVQEKALKAAQDQLVTLQAVYEAQIQALDDQLAQAQAQLDALNGIDNSVISVAAAIAALNAAIMAALAAQPKGSAAANTPGNNSTLLDAVYQSVLGRDPDAAGQAYWSGLLQSGGIDYAGLAAQIKADAQANGELPHYAKGTNNWDGSPALVGEFGPEIVTANNLGGSTIYPAQRSRSLLSGGQGTSQDATDAQTWREKALKKLNEIARNTGWLDIWNSDGLPGERA
jgi:lambda family phage tail tape measure protein